MAWARAMNSSSCIARCGVVGDGWGVPGMDNGVWGDISVQGVKGLGLARGPALSRLRWMSPGVVGLFRMSFTIGPRGTTGAFTARVKDDSGAAGTGAAGAGAGARGAGGGIRAASPHGSSDSSGIDW